jgi:LysM repeat protein
MLSGMTTVDAATPRPAGAPGLSTPSVDARGDEVPRPSVADTASDHANPRGCPFLVAEAGGWRLDMPSRDHRCGAFTPPAPLAPEKQARLCLTPSHTGCATYLASLSARTERVGAAPVRRSTRWGLSRTTSVIEDTGGLRARVLGAVLDRRRWPAIPAVILVTTLFVLALSGFRAGLPASPVATASPLPAAPATATAQATTPPTTAPALEGTAMPSTAPATATPTKVPATPGPSTAHRTYRVKSGDTLSAIASRFGVTVSSIVDLNNLSNPGALSVGQLLLIP